MRKEFLTDSVSLSSFELALSLHAAAPRIEAYYQFYETTVVPLLKGEYQDSCDTWAFLRGGQICSPEQLELAVRETNIAKEYLIMQERANL